MNLYIVRHGEARQSKEDSKRPLTDAGTQEIEKLAAFLKPKNLVLDIVWHSYKTRACQTAQILSRALLNQHGVVERAGLSPNDSVHRFIDELDELEKDIMVVSHLPFVANLVEALTGSRQGMNFTTGGTACLRRHSLRKWELLWSITPGQIC